VAQAFEVLGDARRRAAYDRGEPASSESDPSQDVGFEGFDFSSDAAGTGAGFREIFDGVLGPGAAGDERRPRRGEDLEQVTRISFDEAQAGTERRVQITRLGECPVCKGAGGMDFGPVPCPRCRGSGQVRASRGHLIFSRGCPACSSTGVLTQRPCSRCRGEGRLIQSEWLDVQIPAGAASGSKVRIPECGNAGRNHGRPGDLVLVVEVEEHPLFRREGDDLYSEAMVTIFEAALGAHVEVATPDGAMTIEIPAGTQAGQRFRLRKRGARKLGGKGRGDLYVEARIWVPAITDEQDRAQLSLVAERNPHNPRTAGKSGAAEE
jgi:molecular chaperone DnaJ